MSKTYIGGLCASVSTPPAFKAISKIVVMVDDKNYYTAGDESGRTVEIVCPYGTQAMADNLLAQLGGYCYQPFSAADALVDPAAELGDSVTVGGVYSVYAEEDITFDHIIAPIVSAPGEREMEQEYPFQTQTQQLGRRLAMTYSLISKTAEEIRLEVNGVDGRVSALSVTLDGVTIKSQDGTTRIRGSAIETGSITADKIAANSITADKIVVGTIPTNTSQLNNNSGFIDSAHATIITNNAISTASIRADQITTGTLTAANLNLSGLLPLSYYGSVYGYMGVNTAKGGPVLSDSSMNIFFVTTNNAAKMSYYEQNMIWVASGGCYSSAAIQVYSDRSMKNDISYDLSEEEKLFNSLKPCSFQMSNDPSQKKHWGFIAQEVICGAKDANMDTDKLAVIGSYEDKNTLAYSEFTAINTHMIQKLMARVAELERKVNGL